VEKFIKILSPVLKKQKKQKKKTHLGRQLFWVSKVFNLTKKQSSTEKQEGKNIERKKWCKMLYLMKSLRYKTFCPRECPTVSTNEKEKTFKHQSARKSFEPEINKINSGVKKKSQLEDYHFDRNRFCMKSKKTKVRM
jgi:hypothetical protein